MKLWIKKNKIILFFALICALISMTIGIMLIPQGEKKETGAYTSMKVYITNSWTGVQKGETWEKERQYDLGYIPNYLSNSTYFPNWTEQLHYEGVYDSDGNQWFTHLDKISTDLTDTILNKYWGKTVYLTARYTPGTMDVIIVEGESPRNTVTTTQTITYDGSNILQHYLPTVPIKQTLGSGILEDMKAIYRFTYGNSNASISEANAYDSSGKGNVDANISYGWGKTIYLKAQYVYKPMTIKFYDTSDRVINTQTIENVFGKHSLGDYSITVPSPTGGLNGFQGYFGDKYIQTWNRWINADLTVANVNIKSDWNSTINLYPYYNAGITFDCNGGSAYKNLITPAIIPYDSVSNAEGNFVVESSDFRSGNYRGSKNILKNCFESGKTYIINIGIYSDKEYEEKMLLLDESWNNDESFSNLSKYTIKDLDIQSSSDAPHHFETTWDSYYTGLHIYFNEYLDQDLISIQDFYVAEKNAYSSFSYTFQDDNLKFDDYIKILNPTRDGYIFKGWYTSPTGGTCVSNNSEIFSPVECDGYDNNEPVIPAMMFKYTGDYSMLYAQWDVISHNIHYDVDNNGTYDKVISVPHNSLLPYDVDSSGDGTNDSIGYYNPTGIIFAGYKDSTTGELYYDRYAKRNGYVRVTHDLYLTADSHHTWTDIGDFDVLRDNNEDGVVNYLDWFCDDEGTKEDPYKVSSFWDLAVLSYFSLLGDNFDGKYFLQTADIDLDGFYWIPIKLFSGRFDGNGYKILNLNMYDELYEGEYFFDKGGLFERVEYASSVLENITIESGNIYANVDAGGIVAYGHFLKVQKCVNKANIYGKGHAGGIVGKTYASSWLSNCENYGIIKSDGDTSMIGGIVGFAEYYFGGAALLTDCVNYGTVESVFGVSSITGGIAGFVDNGDGDTDSYTYNIAGNINYGKVSNAEGGCTGGIIGEIDTKYSSTKADIINCINNADVVGVDNVGAIVGFVLNNGTTKIEKCINLGTVTATGDNAGGIVGYLTQSEITSCVNLGNVSANNYAGGIVGFTQSDTTYNTPTTIYGCYVKGNVTATNDVGGIVGRIPNTGNYVVTITQCMFNGEYSGSNGGLLVGSVGFDEAENKVVSTVTITECLSRSTMSTKQIVGSYYSTGATITSTIYETGSGKGYYGTDFTNWSLINGKPIPKDVMWVGGQGVAFTTPPAGYTKVA